MPHPPLCHTYRPPPYHPNPPPYHHPTPTPSQASLDYRADPAMRAHCEGDVQKFCSTVRHGGGRVQECLQQNYFKLSWDCTEELVRLHSEADSDIRLSFKLFTKCLPDKKKVRRGLVTRAVRGSAHAAGLHRAQLCPAGSIERRPGAAAGWPPVLQAAASRMCYRTPAPYPHSSCCTCPLKQHPAPPPPAPPAALTYHFLCPCLQFCADVAPGHALAKECLEDHRGDLGFSSECKQELEEMIERRARDFRIDSRLKRVCEEDILGMCGMFGVGGRPRLGLVRHAGVCGEAGLGVERPVQGG
jgi:hypothetical protein